jgi:hypothetical protein
MSLRQMFESSEFSDFEILGDIDKWALVELPHISMGFELDLRFDKMGHMLLYPACSGARDQVPLRHGPSADIGNFGHEQWGGPPCLVPPNLSEGFR